MKLQSIFEKKKDLLKLPEDIKNFLNSDTASEEICPDDQDITGLSDLYSPEEVSKTNIYEIADILVERGKLTSDQHDRLREDISAKTSSDVVEILLETKQVEADDILMAKAQLNGLEFQCIDPENVEEEVFKKLDIDFIKNNGVVPVAVEEETLVVAASEPPNAFTKEEVKRQTQMKLKFVVCTEENILKICDSFNEEKVDYCVDDILSDMVDVEVVREQKKEPEDLEKMAGQSPVIKFVNYLISNAIHEGASDIHIEPKEKFTKIRYRIDGALFEITQSPTKMHPAMVSRIKIMSNLDISERRLPQDGKISAIVGNRKIDLRISTLPTSRGEKVVIRILDSNSIMRGLEQLGMETKVKDIFYEQTSAPHGIMLVTGPTGSGKTTTLYTALSLMDSDKLNVATVEDPIEYELDFCNQVQTNERTGLSFAAALRSLLRQDPDVIMIGEIRDSETAQIAVQAALTGHLVLSTLHTNDAPSSITRLVDIGIDAYLLAAALNAILAQRLVKKICPNCKENYQTPDYLHKFTENIDINPDQLFRGVGCDQCRGSGYSGRIGIYELLIIDEIYRDMISKDASTGNIQRVFMESKADTLFDDGIKKVKQGLTTIEEVLRVAKAPNYNEDGTNT